MPNCKGANCLKHKDACLLKECCKNKECKNSPLKGSRRELFNKKYTEYISKNKIPKFKNDEEFQAWLTTDQGEKYSKDVETIWAEVEIERPWGGKRESAGRKKNYTRKIPFNRRIDSDILQILKDYSSNHNITETEALERAIKLLSNE